MLPIDGAGAGLGVTTAAAAAELATELTSFTRFRDRVDEILADLKKSPAGARKLGEDPVLRAQFGGGENQWAEAASLFSSYRSVITELESLSRMLSDSIEGMSIAVLASHDGYENLDMDIRRRMLAISDEAKRHYGGPYDPTRPARQSGEAGPRKPAPEPTTGAI